MCSITWTWLQTFVHISFLVSEMQKGNVQRFCRSNTNGTTEVLDGGAVAEFWEDEHELQKELEEKVSVKAAATGSVDRPYKQTVVSLTLRAAATSSTPQIKNAIPSTWLLNKQLSFLLCAPLP